MLGSLVQVQPQLPNHAVHSGQCANRIAGTGQSAGINKPGPERAGATAVKTVPTDASVDAYLAEIDDPAKRADAQALVDMMSEVTGAPAVMWGTSIVGFGQYHYRYESGREGDFLETGFAVRKRALTLYVMAGFAEHDALMARLGKYTIGKSCLYVKRLSDVDGDVLRQLVQGSVATIRARYPSPS